MRQQNAERDLIGRMRARDGSAVADLASLYGPRIQQLAFRYLKNWEDAEEVAQDVLLKVYRKIEAFRGDAALSSWIYRITFNTAMSRLRSGTVQPQRGSADARIARRRMEQRHGRSRRTGRRSPTTRCMRGADAQEADRCADAPARGLSGAGAPARHPGAVDRGGERDPKVKPQTLKSRLHRGRLILRKHLGDFAGGLDAARREAVNCSNSND